MTSVSLFTSTVFETSSLTTEGLLDNRSAVCYNSTLDFSTVATFPKSDDTISSIENITNWIWIVFILGIIGNFGIILVLYRMNRWKKLTYKLILILAISDSVVLCIGLGRQWLRFALDLDIRLFSDFGCKLTMRRSFRRTVRYIPDPQNRERHLIGNKKLTRMIFWTSVYFLLTTLPISIHFCVDSFLKPGSTKETSDKIDLSEAILYLFQFTNYSVNFYIYCKFKDAFREYLPCKRRSRFSLEKL
ncbi:unnamed protein product [Mytilus edulis]|uniref:Uncharacterized protein n=1 Tax=Mytilus edulis TaxID=6550 RepID=A0A8S3SB41_MYTED|nr:unnamed protein product [Mytilus edulis]